MKEAIELIESIKDWLTESDGGNAVTNTDVKYAKEELDQLRMLLENLPSSQRIISESDHQLQEDIEEWNKERMSGLTPSVKDLKRTAVCDCRVPEPNSREQTGQELCDYCKREIAD